MADTSSETGAGRAFHIPLGHRAKGSAYRRTRVSLIRRAAIALVAGTVMLIAAGCGSNGPSGYALSTSVQAAPLTANGQALQGTVDVNIRTGDNPVGDLRLGIERTTDRHALQAQQKSDSSDTSFYPFFFYYPWIFNSTTVDRPPVATEDPVDQTAPEAQTAPDPVIEEPPADAPAVNDPAPVDNGGDPAVNDGGGDPAVNDGGGDPAPPPEPVDPAPVEEGMVFNGRQVQYTLAADTTGGHQGVTLVRVEGDPSATITGNEVDLGKVGAKQTIHLRVVYLVPRGTNDVATLVLSDATTKDVIVPGGGSTDAWPDRALG